MAGISVQPRWTGESVSLPLLLTLIASLGGAQDAFSDRVRCEDCHVAQAAQLDISVHAGSVTCLDCHGGKPFFELDAAELAADTWKTTFINHGRTFTGKPTRTASVNLCGDCHADVARMNPYGLPTDQLAAYQTSGHGKQLREHHDEKVAVCLDCHGSHDILSKSNPRSRTYFSNIPDTCANCHAESGLMEEYGLSTGIIDQYRRSIHGRRVLEQGDSGSPTCSTCHGSHGAVPPGFADISHVCGKCHQQIEEYFSAGIHGRLPQRVQCVACHGGNQDPKNHFINEATPSPETLRELYVRIAADSRAPAKLKAEFQEEVDQLSAAVNPRTVCAKCHEREADRTGHAVFFEQSDQLALERAGAIAQVIRDAQFGYASTATRVEEVSRGVLIVQDEGILAEDAKTALMTLTAQLHTIDLAEIKAGAETTLKICDEINASLDQKQAGLKQRHYAPILVWIFSGIFAALMYWKYRSLKRAMVADPDQPGPTGEAPSMPRRRAAFDMLLTGLGIVAIGSILWPAIVYLLPVSRRGGAAARVVAGKASEWAVWQVRKVSFGSKPLAVLRTPDGFRAFSAVCPHLGCIVHWDDGNRVFACPCHAATFDDEGRVVSGPPPKPLTPYDAKEVQGDVVISETT